jgi:predicted nucleotide-binding protein
MWRMLPALHRFARKDREDATKTSQARVLRLSAAHRTFDTVRQSKLNRRIADIEALRDEHVAYAVVLLTPDDVGCAKDAAPDGLALRPRENVIFELGFFAGKLGAT